MRRILLEWGADSHKRLRAPAPLWLRWTNQGYGARSRAPRKNCASRKLLAGNGAVVCPGQRRTRRHAGGLGGGNSENGGLERAFGRERFAAPVIVEGTRGFACLRVKRME